MAARGFPKHLEPIFNPKALRIGAMAAARMHGGTQHMILMWKAHRKIAKIIHEQGGRVEKALVRHNQQLVGLAGEALSKFRPDVQIIDRKNKVFYIAEAVVTHGGDPKRIPAMKAAIKAKYPDWDVVDIIVK